MNEETMPTSHGYEILQSEVPPELLRGWQEAAVAEKQHKAFAPLLLQMHEGKPREDFVALARAVQITGLDKPLIVEVGCGSGWNSEVLSHLLRRPVRYIGLDYSKAMIVLAKRNYPHAGFVIGDATELPFRDGTSDILLSGTVLMHLLGYRKAIHESRRVARKWCIFHTIPIAHKLKTTMLKKFAYGSPVIEIVYNETEFVSLIQSAGLVIRQVFKSVPHTYLDQLLSEPITAKTYVCEIA